MYDVLLTPHTHTQPIHTHTHTHTQPIHVDVPKHKPLVDTVQGWLYKVFLPEGYPNSVSGDYLPYQMWDTMQAFCSTVTGILAHRVSMCVCV
jgi:hypothetical protein